MIAGRSGRNASDRLDIGVQAPNREEIAVRAYELFMARGQAQGHDLEDWLAAEVELRAARRNVRPPRVAA